MSYGLELHNSKGELMFSSDFAAFHFIGKFTAVRSTNSFTPFDYIVNFSCLGRPIIFIEGLDSGGSAISSCTLSLEDLGNNNFTATILFIQSIGILVPTTQVYIFAFAPNPDNSGFGGFIKSTSGVTMLNLSHRVLKITGAHTTTQRSNSVSSDPPPEPIFSGTIPENYIISCVPVGESLRSSGPSVLGTFFGLVPFRVDSVTVGYRAGTSYGFAPPGVDAFTIHKNQYILFADRTLYQ